MSGAAEGIAGLALSAVSVAALFTTCIECYSLVVAAREFGEDYELLCTELSLQKLRFFLWGESVGLASRIPDVQPRPNPGLDDPVIQPTVIRTLEAIKNLLSETQEFDTRYGFKAEESAAGPSSRGLSIFKGTFDQFKSHARRNQAQKSVATVTRWAIFDADNFETKINRLKSFIDGLESITRSLVALEAQRVRLRQEIESISDVDSLRLLCDISDSDSQDVSDTASRRLSNLEFRLSSEATVLLTRSNTSTSHQTFYSAASHLHEESVRGDLQDLDAEQGATPRVAQAGPTGGEPAMEVAEPELGGSRGNSLGILRRIIPTKTVRTHKQDALPRLPRVPSLTSRKTARYRIVVLGDGGVGKTALTIQVSIYCALFRMELTGRQFTLQHFVKVYDPTIEDSYRKAAVIDGIECTIEILDTAGQEEYTALRDQWIRDGEAFVLVYNINGRSSFARITRFYRQIQRIKGDTQSPIMLVGHDYAEDEQRVQREVSKAEGQSLARELGCDFLEASARNCVNVEKVFHDSVRSLRRQRTSQTTSMPPIAE
jgi:small GTP-binding protein